EAARYFRIGVEDIIVFHDEIDLVPGKVRVKRGGGHAGHNGLRSLHQHIGADFWRVRLGVGHPGHKEQVVGHVLGNFSKVDRDTWIASVLEGTCNGLHHLVEGDSARFLNAIALARD
ncbi:MAG: aminoacyl-tRNA hydrolase, partial [Rhodobacteraceae bacterium]|nr:aminoacyl-tRNA hydrolase [Paracoccaceae bacterium]